MNDIDEIRAALVVALQGETSAGAKVYDSRMVNIEENELPLINIITPAEFPNGTTLLNSMQIITYLKSGRTENLGVLCGTLRRQIKALVKRFSEDEGVVFSYDGAETEFITEASQPHAIMTLTYNVETLDDL